MARGDNLRSRFYRFTVEDCPVILDLSKLESIKSDSFKKFTDSGELTTFSNKKIEFYYKGKLTASILLRVKRESTGIKLILDYKMENEDIQQQIHLNYKSLVSGGKKYYLFCPGCGRMGSKLYFITECKLFMCRKCGDLTYESCKESSRLTNFLKYFAYKSNVSLEVMNYYKNWARIRRRFEEKITMIEKPFEDKIMHTTTLKLGNKQNTDLEELSKKKDLSKSELIRRAIDRFLEEEVERQLKASELNQLLN